MPCRLLEQLAVHDTASDQRSLQALRSLGALTELHLSCELYCSSPACSAAFGADVATACEYPY
jgi:hypothetical protein